MRKSILLALATAAMLSSIPSAAAPDPGPDGVPPIKIAAGPYTLSIGSPVYDVTGNGDVRRAALLLTHVNDVDFGTGKVTIVTSKNPLAQGGVGLRVVALKPNQKHRLYCRVQGGKDLKFSTFIYSPSGGVTGQVKKLTSTMFPNQVFGFVAYDFVLGTDPAQVQITRPYVSGNDDAWLFYSCKVDLAPTS